MIYKDFKGYKIYDTGVVISPKGKEIGSIAPNGYVKVSIDGKKYGVHQLVMKLFVGESKGLDVDHLNGIKNDNRLENLQYVTRQENIKRAWQNGLANAKYGKEMHTTKITDEVIEFIENSNLTGKQLGQMFGINQGSVSRIKNNKQRKCHRKK